MIKDFVSKEKENLKCPYQMFPEFEEYEKIIAKQEAEQALGGAN